MKEITQSNRCSILKTLGIFQLNDAKKAGISQPTLSRMVAQGNILRLGHGLYMHPDSFVSPEEQDYVQACSKFGSHSIIGGLTALFYYGLIDKVPTQVWVIVPQSKRTVDSRYRLIRMKNLSPVGVETHKLFRITTIERTLVEGLQYSSKIGIRTAISAIRRAVTEKKTTLAKIMTMAQKLNLENVVKKHWETINGSILE